MSDNLEEYWFPEVLPENSEEYNKLQLQKLYLTPDNKQKAHPNWHYENGALVDDEYLFQNEGWKIVINTPPVNTEGNVDIEMNDPKKWRHEEKIVYPTYTYREIVDNRPQLDESIFNIIKNPSYEWERTDDEVIITYNVTDKTEEQKQQYLEGVWKEIRRKRNELLQNTDHYIMISNEQNKILHEDFINYRQLLRDLPNNLDNPLEEIIWPELPINIFK